MNLGTRALMNQIEELAKERYPAARVDFKYNARDELVIAVILPGPWNAGGPTRDEKARARRERG